MTDGKAEHLEKTLLSKAPRKGSFQTTLLASTLLLLVFTLDQQNLWVTQYFQASSDLIFKEHQYWRLFTSSLMHADLEHIISNLPYFFGLSFLLSAYFSFWLFPVVSFLAGGIINFLVLKVYASQTPLESVTLVGASGIVYFMAAVWLTLYFHIERGLTPVRRLLNSIGFSLMLLVPDLVQAKVSYLSHATGFVLGILVGSIYFFMNRKQIRGAEVWVTSCSTIHDENNPSDNAVHQLDSCG
jgi:rhomboid protease GluP